MFRANEGREGDEPIEARKVSSRILSENKGVNNLQLKRMEKDAHKRNIFTHYPLISVALGFLAIVIISWLDEAIDFPHLFFSAQRTLFNWKEALIESVFTGMIGLFTVLKLRDALNKRKKAEEALIRFQEALKIEKQKLEEVLNIDRQISSILKLNQLIDFVIEQAVNLLNVKRLSLMMLDPTKDELIIKGSRGLEDTVIKNTRLLLGSRIAGLVAKEGKPILVRDIAKSDFAMLENCSQYKSKSFMAVPIILHNSVVGVVNVTEKESDDLSGQVFTEIDLKILCSIIHQAAISIENANYYQRLEYLTQTDSLTGLFNHRHFVQALDQEIMRAKRYSRPLSLLMLDVDEFKDYNDMYGHLEGDKLLKKASLMFKGISRSVEICCRYAGDEFAIILPETGISQAKIVADKINNGMKSLDLKKPVTLSIGIAEFSKNATRYDFVLKADRSLYDVKKAKKIKSSIRHDRKIKN